MQQHGSHLHAWQRMLVVFSELIFSPIEVDLGHNFILFDKLKGYISRSRFAKLSESGGPSQVHQPTYPDTESSSLMDPLFLQSLHRR